MAALFTRLVPLAIAIFGTSTVVAAPPANLPPIKIGAISSLLGGATEFSASGLAAQALFDSVNASGGIQKRKLVYLQDDDGGNPASAGESAAKFIADPLVVAMAGSASYMECAVNANAYQAAGLVSVPGLALDGRCFKSPMISPVNAGPYVQLELAMRFATQNLKATKLCVMRLGTPANLQAAFDAVVQSWTDRTGIKPVLDERNIRPDDKPDAYIANAAQAGCDAIVFGGNAPFSLAYAKAARQGLPRLTPLIFLGSVYTVQIAETLMLEGEGIYTMSEFEPWSSRSGSLSEWRSLMTSSKVPLTSISQGGFVSAQVLVRVLRSIKGDITRASVTQAFKKLQPYDVPMMGMPYTFGEAAAHHANQAAVPMQLSGGRWRIAHHDWIRSLSTVAYSSPTLAVRKKP